MTQDTPLFWGELRSLLHGTPSHEAFLDVLSLLRAHPQAGMSSKVRAYVQAHALKWGDEHCIGWGGDFERGLEWLAPSCRVLTASLFPEAPLHFERSPVTIETACGPLTLAPILSKRSPYGITEFTGRGVSEDGIQVHAWEGRLGRIELSIVPMRHAQLPPMEDMGSEVKDGYVATWCILAHEPLEGLTLQHACSPYEFIDYTSPASGEQLEAIEWRGCVSEHSHALSAHLCVGSHDAEAMMRHAEAWWPEGNPCNIWYAENALNIELMPLMPGQRSVIRSAASWGHYSVDRVDAWITTDLLLTAWELPKLPPKL